MRLKLDENLPGQLVPILTDLGHDVDTVPDEYLAGQDDDAVWAAAQAARRFLVTQDLDFSDARRYAPGTHHGLLLVRLPAPGRQALVERISTLFRTEAVETWKVAWFRRLPRKSASGEVRDDGRHHRRSRPTVDFLGEDWALPLPVSRARRRLPTPIREPKDRQVRLRARLCE